MIVSAAAAARLAPGLAALGAAAVLTEAMRRLALRHRLIDQVDGKKAHREPTPYLGGAAIALSSLVVAVLFVPAWSLPLGALMAAAAIVALLGLRDDIVALGPVTRLQVEAGLATLVVLAGVRLTVFGDWLDAPATIVWIVLLTNSFNLLDNIDGAAGIVGSTTAAALAVAALAENRGNCAVILLALSGGCAGFLVHNWTPARIFMGDCGSLFVGFVIATMAVLVPSSQAGSRAPAFTLLCTLIPLVDTAIVMTARRLAGRPLLLGGTDHISHRLRRLGLSTAQVGLFLFAATGLASCAGVLVLYRLLPPVTTLAVFCSAALALAAVLLKVAVYPQAAAPERRTPLSSTPGSHTSSTR